MAFRNEYLIIKYFHFKCEFNRIMIRVFLGLLPNTNNIVTIISGKNSHKYSREYSPKFRTIRNFFLPIFYIFKT